MFLLGSSFQVSIEASARLVELYEAVARALDVAPWEVRLTASTSYLISCSGGRLILKPYQWRGFRFNAPCFFLLYWLYFYPPVMQCSCCPRCFGCSLRRRQDTGSSRHQGGETCCLSVASAMSKAVVRCSRESLVQETDVMALRCTGCFLETLAGMMKFVSRLH